MLARPEIPSILEIVHLGYIKTFIFYSFKKRQKEIISKHHFVVLILYFSPRIQANY